MTMTSWSYVYFAPSRGTILEFRCLENTIVIMLQFNIQMVYFIYIRFTLFTYFSLAVFSLSLTIVHESALKTTEEKIQ